ncbi:MAG: tryptophan 7-halogenase [Christensenellaceae bacterium]|jgi:flavin-dependent dehydrogenase|nr:tryptophan 7-halogenase [Christensenellaceae bacterium]
MKYDVIIVGAGIAGTSAAINLKKLDDTLKILVIEKYTFPRSKLCAGYLTKKSTVLFRKLGIDVEALDYKLVKGLSIIYKGRTRIHSKNHGLYCQKLVDRTVLDYALFQQLNDVDILENTNIKSLHDTTAELSDGSQHEFASIIFSDGEAGYSSKFNDENKKYFCMQVNFEYESTPKIDMFFGIVHKGYAWCASSGAYINIGFCDIYDEAVDYKKIFEGFCGQLGFQEHAENARGFFVPFSIKKNRIINDTIYLVGDSVGLVDPLTLAGISYAVIGGECVAKSIVHNDNEIYLGYLKKVELKFRILALISKILYAKLFLFIFVSVCGRFLGKPFSYVLDKFILNKTNSFHE